MHVPITAFRCALPLLLTAILAAQAPMANAEWALNNEKSSLSFVSTKAVDVGELHHFERLSGSVDKQGTAMLTIDLTSVNTAIAIRDERMRDLLFETDRFPQATLAAKVPIAELARMQAGELRTINLEGTLGLRGSSVPLSSEANVVMLADGSLQVISKTPILVNAKNLDLLQGVERLREIAGLPSIGQNVTVTYDLNFRP